MRGIIDRFEGDYAVIELENLEVINILKDNLPQNAKEGDVVVIKDNKYYIDIEETRRRNKQIEEFFKDLFEG
ncbi:pyruvate kinase [Caloranaerobacter azorensis H53214]|nr:pyruvate kinase [Caloranaerobacter azorensis H53214]